MTSLYLVFEEGKKNGSVGDETKTDDAPIQSDQHILGSLRQSEIVHTSYLVHTSYFAYLKKNETVSLLSWQLINWSCFLAELRLDF